LSIKDIEDMGEFLKIQILETKTKVPREFTITPGNVSRLNLLEVFRRYSSLRSKNTRHQRFFVGYRLGKCIAHPVGINTIGGAPKQIATFLGLKNPEEYTGHAFRRSSATLLAESGADTSILKQSNPREK
jgi:integrase